MRLSNIIRPGAKSCAGLVLTLAAGLASGPTAARAQSAFTWDGGDGSSLLWSTPGNWNPDGAPPGSFNANFTFGGVFNTGTAGNPLTNDLPTGTITNFTFSAGAGSFYIGGNTFTNRGHLTNASGVAQSLSAGMVMGVNAPATTNTHFVNVGTGSVTLSGPITAPTANATTAKIGAGTLYYTSPLTNTLGNGTPGGATGYWVPGYGVDEGTVIFDGGPTSVYNIVGEGSFGRTAPTGNKNVSVFLQSGTVSGSSWIAIGRGNGAGEVSANLTLNGSAVFNPVNWSGCYNAGDATKRPLGTVVQNGTSLFWVKMNGANGNFAESAGSYLTHTVNDSATLTVGDGTAASAGRARLGIAGRFVLKQTSPTATVIFGQTHFGDAAGGAGVFYNRGIFRLTSPASTDHFAIGAATGGATPANNSYGYYLNDTTTTVGLSEIGVGGAGGGNGVLEVKQGTVNVTNWITICRYGTATNYDQSAELLVRNGTVNAPNVEQFRYLWSASANQYGVVDIGAGGKIGSLGTASAINLANSANPNGTSLLTAGGGAVLEVGRIFAGQAAPLTVVNFNGCTLNAITANTAYLGANLDGVYVHAGGVNFDTKGFDVTALPTLSAPTDNGISSIPVTTAGAGYLGRPIVRLTGGGGLGATAVAEWNESAGTITGVTITAPGSGYYETPTVTLIGGGFTTAATLGTPVLGPVTSGGLTKTSAGMLTLSGGYTYTGPTVVGGGTLNLNTVFPTPGTGGTLVVSNATLTVDASSGIPLPASDVALTNATLNFAANPFGNSLNAIGNVTLQSNTVLNFNFGTLSANPYAAAINVTGNLTVPSASVVLSISGFGLQIGQFPLFQYGGTVSGFANLSLGPLTPGIVASLVNNTANRTVDLKITAANQNLTWYGSASTNWDINTTPNWNSGAAVYLEYTTPYTLGDPVHFDDTLFDDFVNPPATNVNLTTTLRPFSVGVDATLPYSFTGPGQFSGIGSLVKSNTGSLTIGTSNDYTGGTFLYGGSLIISNNAGLGAPAGAVTLGGGALQINGNLTNTRPITVSVDNPLNVAAGTTAQFGGTFSGAGRLLLQDAGTVIITNNNRLQFHVRQGTLVFDGSARITNTTSFSSVGLGTGDNGSLIVRSNATFEINMDLNLGDVSDARGRLDLRDNAVIRTLNLWLGKNNTCTGLVYQTGGILTNHLTGGTDWRIAGNTVDGTATFGGYYLSGGRVDVQKNFQIGAYGTGEMVISGGTVNQWVGYPAVGRYTNGIGTLTLSGGQFNQLNTGAFLILGENGTGTLNLSGTGVVTLTNSLRLGGAGGSGTVNLGAGGRLATPGVQLMAADGTAMVNFDGGTLQAKAHNSTFLQGLTTANVLAGGVRIDSAGWDITLAQPLLNGGGGGGGLTKVGIGTLTLAGACTYTGATLVSTGRVLVTPAFTASGPITVADGAAFGASLVGSGVATVGSLTLGSTGATTLDISLGTNGNPVAPVLLTGPLTVNGTAAVRLAGKIALGTFPLVQYTGALGGTGTFSPNVSAAQGMVATLSNNVANSTLYVTVSSLGSGIVWSGTNSPAALTNVWALNSVTNWWISGTPTTYQEPVPPGDAVTFNDAGSGLVLLSNSASPLSVLFTNVTKNYTLRGSGRIAGATGLNKQGAGTLTVALTANDYSGDTVVGGGTLRLGSATTIPDGAGKGNLVVNAGGTVDLAGWTETVNGLAGSGLVNNASTTNVVFTIGNGDSGSTWNGTLTDGGAGGGVSLTKIGANTVTIGGSNYLNNASATQAQAASQVNGGTLIITTNGYLNTSVGELWIAQNATTSSVVVAGGTLVVANNWIAIGRNNSNAVGTLTVNSGTVIKSGNGNIVLGSLGGTGTLIVNGGQVLNNSMLWLGEGATANGYFYLNGGFVQASQVRSNNNAGFPVNAIAYLNGGTLQATANSADYFQCAALVQSKGFTLDDGGLAVTLASAPLMEDTLSSGGGVTKTGAGTLYLNTINTYTGLTLVTNGTLAGTGSVMGPVTIAAGGNLAPGGAGTNVGTFTLDTKPLTLHGNATFRINKVGGLPENDRVAGISTAHYGGTLTVNNLNTEPLAVGDQFPLFSASAGATGSFSAIVGSAGFGLAYQFTPASGILSVVPGATNPTNITYSLSENTLTLDWPATHLGWILQSQTNSLNVGIANNWVDVPGSGASTQAVITINPATPAVFFRLRNP